MNKFVVAGAAVGALAITAASAHPHQGDRQAAPVTRAAVEARVDAGFARLDSDRDGFVTEAEARARAEAFRAERQERRGERREALFARLDADRDGQISRAEFDARPALRGDRDARSERRGERRGLRAERRGGHGGMFARLGARQFERADADRDGRVSREEARRGALALFDRVDTDRDGTLSIEERRAAREAFRGQRAQRRRG